MSSFIIKIIAIIFMSIDHTGKVLLDNQDIYRFLGRIAFPLFAFLLVEGFNHTKDDKKRLANYFKRLIILAIISEPIYDKLMHNSFLYLGSQNILFTLVVGLLCMDIYYKSKKDIINKLLSLSIIFYIAIISEVMFLDYGFRGIILIFLFFVISNLNIKQYQKNILYFINMIIYIILTIFIDKNLIILGSLFALIPIYLYNYELGYNKKIVKYLFYLYYPVHLLILLIIKIF